MSTGKWKPRDTPPDYQPTSLLAQIALKHEELAAIEARCAQVHGELSQLFRTAQTPKKSALPADDRKSA